MESASQCMGTLGPGPIEGGIEVQRTIKRPDTRALWVALRGLCAPATIHTGQYGHLEWIAPRREDVHCPESQRSRSMD